MKQRFHRISGDGNGGGHAGDKVNTGPRSCGKIHGCETGGMVLYTAVDYAVSEKLFNGTSATTFAPNEAMTRGMFVTVLGNKAKIDPKDYPTSSFSDVKAGVWYAPNVEWAAQNGIVNGAGGGKFSPDKSVTREQMGPLRVPAYDGNALQQGQITVLERSRHGTRPFTIYSMEEWLWTLSNWNIGSLTRKALAG